MHMKRGLSNFLLKTHYYSNNQLIVHQKVEHNILGMKNEIIRNQYV